MRIAQVCPYDLDRPGGVQLHIYDLSLALREQGHEVTIIAPRSPSAKSCSARYFAASGIHVIRVGEARVISNNKTSWNLTWATGADRQLLDRVMTPQAFDVVHFHTLMTPFLSYQIFLRTKVAKVATFHDVPPASKTGSVLRVVYGLVDRLLLPRLDAVILTSDLLRRFHNARLAPSCSVLPPCTDLNRFSRQNEPLPAFCDGSFNILFPSRLDVRKGPHVMLEAFRALRAEGHSVRLIFTIGEGGERPAMERFIAEHGLSEIVFAGGVDYAETPRWFATADVVCAPSLDGEGFGIVLVEAMASGTPVVAAANEGYSRVLTGEGAQLLSIPGDAVSLSAILRRLILDPELRLRLGRWGRQEAVRYDCFTLAATFASLYEKAVQVSAQRR